MDNDYSFEKDKFGFKEEAFETFSLSRKQREDRRLRNLRKKNLPKGKITTYDQYSLADLLCVYKLFRDKFKQVSPITYMMLLTLYELEHFTAITVQSLLHTTKEASYVAINKLCKQGVMEVFRGNINRRNGYMTLYKLSYKTRYLINQSYKMLYGDMEIPKRYLPKPLHTPSPKK